MASMPETEEIKVAPGSLTPDEAMRHLLAEKFCEGCGVRLNFWATMPRSDYHSLHCPHGPLA